MLAYSYGHDAEVLRISLLTLMAGVPKHKNNLTNHISFKLAYSYSHDAEAKNLLQ